MAQAARLEVRMPVQCEAVRADKERPVREAVEDIRRRTMETPQEPKGFRCRLDCRGQRPLQIRCTRCTDKCDATHRLEKVQGRTAYEYVQGCFYASVDA